jgi:hypothetical protein
MTPPRNARFWRVTLPPLTAQNRRFLAWLSVPFFGGWKLDYRLRKYLPVEVVQKLTLDLIGEL